MAVGPARTLEKNVRGRTNAFTKAGIFLKWRSSASYFLAYHCIEEDGELVFSLLTALGVDESKTRAAFMRAAGNNGKGDGRWRARLQNQTTIHR
jgi:hypothetical protein